MILTVSICPCLSASSLLSHIFYSAETLPICLRSACGLQPAPESHQQARGAPQDRYCTGTQTLAFDWFFILLFGPWKLRLPSPQ